MSRQDANAAFASTSFLYGGNASYVDELYARYEADPNAVDADWQAFFRSLKDDRAAVLKSARGPSWTLPNWPHAPRDDFITAIGLIETDELGLSTLPTSRPRRKAGTGSPAPDQAC